MNVISDFFNSMANNLWDAAPIGFTAAITAGTLILAWKKGRDAIRNGQYEGHEAVLYRTTYRPSGTLNIKTGNEMYDQSIITVDNSVSLEEVFHHGPRRRILGYIDQAKKLCTMEEPAVFVHLKEVIPLEMYEELIEQIHSQWVNYFSMRKAHDTLTECRESARKL